MTITITGNAAITITDINGKEVVYTKDNLNDLNKHNIFNDTGIIISHEKQIEDDMYVY